MTKHVKHGKKGRKGLPSKEKAAEILRHGEVRGKPLTKGQQGLMGMIAGGKKPTRTKR